MMEIDIETFDTEPTDHEDSHFALLSALELSGALGPTVSSCGFAGGIGASFGLDLEREDDATELFSDYARAGVDVFERACKQSGVRHGPIAQVSVLTEEMLDLEVNREPETYLGVAEVAQTLGVSRQRVAELRTKLGFPAPIAELAAGPVWKASSLGRFIAEWDRKPGRPRKRTA
jgi:hypothetical protein